MTEKTMKEKLSALETEIETNAVAISNLSVQMSYLSEEIVNMVRACQKQKNYKLTPTILRRMELMSYILNDGLVEATNKQYDILENIQVLP